MKTMKMQSLLVLSIALVTFMISDAAQAEWTVDLSRRTQQMRRKELNPNYGREEADRGPAAVRMYDGEEPPTAASERQPDVSPNTATDILAVSKAKSNSSFIERVFDPGEPSQDIVILNTERGFVPNTIRVRKDGRYTVHVVNVNDKEKNVSFILDGFAEHHATFFGKVKTFRIEPRKEGVFSFLSPETAVEGKFIVYSAGPASVRAPATAQFSPSLGGE